MRGLWSFILLGVLLAPGRGARAELLPSETEENLPALTEAAVVTLPKVSDTLSDEIAATQLLVVGLRSDFAFSAGGAVEQGFSLAGLRLNISGEVAPSFDYRVALAPSREFSSVLISQVTPVEAWIQFRDGREAQLLWKIGMFAPQLNPYLTADLADLPIPNVARTHRATLLSRELGTEVTFRPGRLDLSAGFFNGNGIVALNTNNAKAFTGSGVLHFALGDGARLKIGLSAYSLRQSELGSINLIANSIGSIFAIWQLGEVTQVGLDIATGRLRDSSRYVGVSGVTATAFIGLTQSVRAYLRTEVLRYSPAFEPNLNRLQLGPAFDPFRGLRVFSYYEYFDDGRGNSENALQFLVRLSL